ncbi:helix-turn-helix transcriptional regulator [Streptomyces sp. N2-109]|uniref:Helix-turn-helix transcriptional regulator n=1 Tax=Streptomyces gossypii TaxID=2883101 RepID=A0ABT2JR28_9ACTN|nr:helix-turn-helix domain-containing protein [Streptomyces gossypii]MCT2590340.1 helix-turn-helix transcriptional regulator [Streptomyces gossypii]
MDTIDPDQRGSGTAVLLADTLDCPSRPVLDLLGSKWSVLIILNLAAGTCRFTELRKAVTGITPKVLTANLRGLERDGLVSREIFAEVPPRTEYSLTPLGESLLVPYKAVQDWAWEHWGTILERREGQSATRPAAG